MRKTMMGQGQHTDDARELKTAGEYRHVADEHVQTLKDFWKNFLVSGLFVVATIVIILACLAWFYNNSQVRATGASVSAAANEFALMANTTDANANKGIYDNGESADPKHSLNTVDAMLVDSTSNFNNNSGNPSTELGPGSAGKFELKIHRYNKSLNDFTVTIDFDKSGTGNDGKISALLNGHILFFTGKSEGYYSGLLLLGDDGKRSLSVHFSDSVADEQSFTVYWVWPLRLSNVIAPGGSRYDSGLFKNAESSDYKTLMRDFNYQDSSGQYSHRNRYFDDGIGTAGEVSNAMDNAAYSKCSNQYDAADDYIGGNVKYIQVKFEASKSSSNNAGETQNGGN